MRSREQSAGMVNGAAHEISFQLPDTLTQPLWKSLLGNARACFFPERLPPLRLTSRPVNMGMFLGDRLALPWYRTVFTNLGEVITPDSLPPLELESRPVDVGELISDMLSHPWWSSLLRNLADRIAPERLPALELTSSPVEASLQSGPLQLLRWSALLPMPVVPPSRPRMAVTPQPAASGTVMRPIAVPLFGSAPAAVPKGEDQQVRGSTLVSKLSWSRAREVVWITIAMAEVAYLVVSAVR